MRMRFMFLSCCCCFFGKRNFRLDPQSPLFWRLHAEDAARNPGARAHPGHPETMGSGARFLDAFAVILNAQADPSAGSLQRNAHFGGPGMPRDVREGLLCYTEQMRFG